jgi:hypothetical protein
MNGWIPALSTTSLLALAVWLFRSLIATRLTKSVEFEFDRKLEDLRAAIRENEESFRAELRSKENEIAALRTGALSGLASRQAVLDERRIEATGELWKAVVDLGRAKGIAIAMSVIKFESSAKLAAENPQLREMFATISGGIDKNQFFTQDAELTRPFVSDVAWALYSAYRAIFAAATTKLEILKSGLGPVDVIDDKIIQKLIITALPHQSEFVTKFGCESYYYLLDELETRLISELRQFMQGGEADKSNIERAAEILKQSHAVMQSLQKSIAT